MSRCTDPAPARLRQGIEEFNRGAFFTCHETLEVLWKQEPVQHEPGLQQLAPVRELYQGIIQIAAALHHVDQGNHRGAVILLERGLARLRPLPAECQEIALVPFIRDVERVLFALVRLGVAGLPNFDRDLIPRLRMKSHADA